MKHRMINTTPALRATPLHLRREVLLLLFFASVSFGQSRYGIQDKETIRRTLEFSAGSGTKVLEIDNVTGGIQVRGYDGRNVEMIVNKTLSAESRDRMQAAKTEVKLDITEKSDTVRIVRKK